MNRPFLTALLATGLLAGSTSAFAENSAAPVAQKQTPLLKVHELKSAAEFNEFQQNVQVMQAEFQAVTEAKAALDKEKDAKKKKDLQAKLDAATKKFNEDSATMHKIYGFPITRTFIVQPEAASIYLPLSDEEAKQAQQQLQAQQAAQQKAKK
jgi:hypothetical protein